VSDTRFNDLSARLHNHDALDEAISSWTREHTQDEVAAWLQGAGVAAGPVMDPPAILADVHVADRGFWLTGEHARLGPDLVTGNPIRLHDTPGWIDRAGPSLGQDNADVLGDVCGYSDDEQTALVDAGAVFPMASPELRLRRPYLAWAPAAFPHLPWSTEP
jgi:crotonobetainyl-CoA:carnitine CoA-transferase CaiB-like acyl-CoA transferase